MNREASIYGGSFLAVVVGLAILLIGEYAHVRTATYGGGVLVLAAVGLMALTTARL
jgi:hypothetical protein